MNKNTKIRVLLCFSTCINGKFQCFGTSCEGKCEDDEFMCTNGDCIDKMYYCDGHPDCNDGSDEKCSTYIYTVYIIGDQNCAYPCLDIIHMETHIE